MSAKIIPWPTRRSANKLAASSVYLPAFIDGRVTVHALAEGLAAAGLRLHHDPASGQFVIVSRDEP
jgi:hypothetical protein